MQNASRVNLSPVRVASTREVVPERPEAAEVPEPQDLATVNGGKTSEAPVDGKVDASVLRTQPEFPAAKKPAPEDNTTLMHVSMRVPNDVMGDIANLSMAFVPSKLPQEHPEVPVRMVLEQPEAGSPFFVKEPMLDDAPVPAEHERIQVPIDVPREWLQPDAEGHRRVDDYNAQPVHNTARVMLPEDIKELREEVLPLGTVPTNEKANAPLFTLAAPRALTRGLKATAIGGLLGYGASFLMPMIPGGVGAAIGAGAGFVFANRSVPQPWKFEPVPVGVDTAKKGIALAGNIGGSLISSQLAYGFKLIPSVAIAPVAIAAGMVNTLTGLDNLSDITNSIARLERLRDEKGLEQINLAAGPDGSLTPTRVDHDISDTIAALNTQARVGKANLLGNLMVAGAGGAWLAGAETAAKVMGVGGFMAGPFVVGKAIAQWDQLQQIKKERAEMEEMLAKGQLSYIKEVEVEEVGKNGRPTGKTRVQKQEFIVEKQIEGLKLQEKAMMVQLASSAVTGGVITAIAAGAPVMYALGGFAIPLVMGVAMNLKQVGGAIAGLGRGIAGFFKAMWQKVFGDKDLKEARSQVKDLRKDVLAETRTLQGIDSEAGAKLKESFEAWSSADKREDRQKHSAAMLAALQTLEAKDPGAVKVWKEALEKYQQAETELARGEYLATLDKQVDAYTNSDLLNAAFVVEGVPQGLDRLGITEDQAAEAMGKLHRAQLGEPSQFQELAQKAQAGDADAKALLEAVGIVGAGLMLNEVAEHFGNLYVDFVKDKVTAAKDFDEVMKLDMKELKRFETIPEQTVAALVRSLAVLEGKVKGATEVSGPGLPPAEGQPSAPLQQGPSGAPQEGQPAAPTLPAQPLPNTDAIAKAEQEVQRQLERLVALDAGLGAGLKDAWARMDAPPLTREALLSSEPVREAVEKLELGADVVGAACDRLVRLHETRDQSEIQALQEKAAGGDETAQKELALTQVLMKAAPEALRSIQRQAADEFRKSLDALGQKDAAAAGDFEAANRQLHELETQRFKALTEQRLDHIMSQPVPQATLASQPVQKALQDLGLGAADAAEMYRLVARANLTGDTSELGQLQSKKAAGDKGADKLLTLGAVIVQTETEILQYLQAQQAQAAQAPAEPAAPAA
ncbi:MAG: hypothetical protein HY319_24240 [Armatimonadetes bacterium]|nr:hypothetical protein [Armatimonadota bacterium]